jgi:hypothetical protein
MCRAVQCNHQHILLNRCHFAPPLHPVLLSCAGPFTASKASVAAPKPARSLLGSIENLLHEDYPSSSGFVPTKPDFSDDSAPSSSSFVTKEGCSVEVG